MSQGGFVAVARVDNRSPSMKDKRLRVSRKTEENQRMDGRTCRPCSAHVGKPKQGDVVVA